MKELARSLYGLCLLPLTIAHFTQHYRYSNNARVRRQIVGGTPPEQIDLNITVPFIFSARLYPYGESRQHNILRGAETAITLRQPITIYNRQYSTVYITRDGVITTQPNVPQTLRSAPPENLPPLIAVYWTSPVSLGRYGRVYYLETQDRNVLNLAKSEVQIQYKYDDNFEPISVLIVTWENVAPHGADNNLPQEQRNTFQTALILSNNGTFAHFVYSKLRWNDNAVAAFRGAERGEFYNLPGSGTGDSLLLANASDIGIPGEWLFKIDGELNLCAPGFKGLECIEECDRGQWWYDCKRRCACESNAPCDPASGVCVNGRCKEGWGPAPVCDQDIDECAAPDACPPTLPDCINTQGAFVCTCSRGYDNETGLCIGSTLDHNNIDGTPQFVEVVPIQPQVVTPRLVGSNISIPQRPPQPTVSFQTPPPQQQTSISASSRIVPQFPPSFPTQPPPPRTTPRQRISTLFTPFSPITQTPTTDVDCGCGADAHCERIPPHGQAQCVCNSGFSGDGHFCVDINECFMENECPPQAQCRNEIGSYTCLCPEGFVSDDANGCVDIDECAEVGVECPGGDRAICVNTVGSFECRCRQGYNGNPASILGCIDINECLIPEFYCGPNADCNNIDGSFECTCHKGFERENNGTECVDIDECLRAPCHPAAVCTNTLGSYTCSCLQGFQGDGTTCQDLPRAESVLFPFDRNADQKMPADIDAAAELPLRRPVHILGKTYNKIFISVNGIVSFDKPILQYEDRPLEQMNIVALAPLYSRIDLRKGRDSGVYVRQPIDAGDFAADYSTLTRASLNVEQDFKKQAFVADGVLVVTYDRVMNVDGAPPSTVQVIVTSGGNETYATYIYNDVGDRNARAAVLGGSAEHSVVLPSQRFYADSNIGEAGRWMFRLDNMIACPAGTQEPPYCQEQCAPGQWGVGCTNACRCANGVPCDFETGFCANRQCQSGFEGDDCQFDIDECATGQHQCAVEAQCINTVGSYNCRCAEGYTGDGITCELLSACRALYGRECAPAAACVIDIQGQPQCVCANGHDGDGFACTPRAPTSAATVRTTQSVATIAPAVTTVQTRPPTQRTSVITTTTARRIDNNVMSTSLRPPIVVTQPPHITTTRATTVRKQGTDDELTSNSILTAGGRRADRDNMSNLLVIVIPSVLCGVWLILIIVLLVVCLRRRRQRQRAKLTYAHPQQAAVAAAKYTATGDNAAANAQATWAIPRPNYDYYQSAYYPYSQSYKY